MDSSVLFLLNSFLLGLGLAMDAFSVSVADGLAEPGMRRKKAFRIAGTFAGFQALMPLIGWICVNLIEKAFISFQRYVPWIALLLLVYIGGKMIIGGIKHDSDNEAKALSGGNLLMQGTATSIDALSVGFTNAGYHFGAAVISSLIIGAVTFCICYVGIHIGRKVGTKLSDKASIFGGTVLILIGIEIVVKALINK